ncbi:glycoside hydrolase family 132 protein [Dissoconium aciculare CBS 342.82]|uniref:Glycoside hydrolase family 132 protein n=1 Tax=Dissoconium aciculare CBS 342.82 TaxID=1314786 RepID=A0A6J3M2P6_9PEZI|nr:glycoside hydrolase family 132 protein [Dissoconium aciculare CBS 342.82]KAF1821197.1 glycoside hydrolase family 132 protein [Dissoconium aciculare CBS 342.82]
MKLTITLLAAAVAVSASQQHQHAHQHLHEKRDPTPAAPAVAEATEYVYILGGKPISEDDVNRGIKNGTLVWADNGALAAAPPVKAAPAATSKPAPAPAPSQQAAAAPAAVAVSANVAVNVGSGNKPSGGSPSGGGGVDTPFPDGTLDCSHFPSDYGAVAVDYLHLGGWIGVQNPKSNVGGLLDAIETVVSSLCLGGNCCQEGMFCSYACPPGYQKSQWPESQGATGQSVGGLQCKNGKLRLTNTGLSSNLCIKGSDQITVQVKNTLGKNVAVCRTDYPGTESETVPVDVAGGSTNPLACPDADKYYKWKGGATSAQYYINPAGVPVSDACQWGTAANPWGNFAPTNLGVGWKDGRAWLSVFQNHPTTDAKLDYTITIKGDGISGTCRYQNGQYCGGANYNDCSSTGGCTVSFGPGSTATFEIS